MPDGLYFVEEGELAVEKELDFATTDLVQVQVKPGKLKLGTGPLYRLLPSFTVFAAFTAFTAFTAFPIHALLPLKRET